MCSVNYGDRAYSSVIEHMLCTQKVPHLVAGICSYGWGKPCLNPQRSYCNYILQTNTNGLTHFPNHCFSRTCLGVHFKNLEYKSNSSVDRLNLCCMLWVGPGPGSNREESKKKTPFAYLLLDTTVSNGLTQICARCFAGINLSGSRDMC